jgi:predicted SAM-dependent methyltransferase
MTLKNVLHAALSPRTVKLIHFDLLRLRARLASSWRRPAATRRDKLHFGCGSVRIPGWLNVDVAGSDWDIDLGSGSVPWPDNSFDVAVGLHVIEHLELHQELLPLLRELRRVIRPGGTLWVSTPDLETICEEYEDDRLERLLADRRKRFPSFDLGGAPTVHLINHFFNQNGEHRNLFDFPFLEWTLRQAGLEQVERADEHAFLERFAMFPRRDDDLQSVYVRATVPA